ncbi:MAG TPA: hypothetical protein V6D34_15585 [Candidatus Sericytochromatia bacterium]
MALLKAQLLNAQKKGAIAILCVSLIGCASLSWSKTESNGVQPVNMALSTVTIDDIKQTSANTLAQTKSVQLRGRVSNHAPLLGKSAYELQDTTGSIWVIATEPIPSTGDEVIIQGKLLYQSIPLNGKEQGDFYIEQHQLLQRSPAVKSDRGGMGNKG